MNEQLIRVCVVEDLDEIREALVSKIKKTEGMQLINAYRSAEDALKSLLNDQPMVVLMDIGLPYMSGIECMLRLKMKQPGISFCMFTVFDSDDKVFEALKSGADGYVLKREGAQGVVNAIQELAAGGAPMSQQIARKVMGSFHKFGPLNKNVERLTPRQIEILQHLSKGLLYKEIADALTPSITVGGLKQNINRIYKKLQVNNRTEAINKYLGENRS